MSKLSNTMKKNDAIKDGTIALVSTPIGNLADITYRAVEYLRNADVIACEDTRNTSILLNHYQIKPKKLISLYAQTEAKNSISLVDEVKEKKLKLAYCSDAGMPGISDPGSLLIKEAIKQNVQVTVLPGPNAALSALVLSGLDTADFSFYGFLPTKSGNIKTILNRLKENQETLIFYESPNRVISTLHIMKEIFGNDRQFALVRELTKIYEEVIRGTLGEVDELIKEVRGECVIIVDGYHGEKEIDEHLLKKEISRLLKEGKPLKECAKELSLKYNLKKNQIYKLGLDI